MTKLIVRLVGGLGNQLFTYAAARRLAFANDAELVLDDTSGFAYDHVYKRRYQLGRFSIPCRKATPSERLEPFSRARRFLLRKLNKNRAFGDRNYIQQEYIDFDARLLGLRLKGTNYLEGLWQSESYFKDLEKTIRKDLMLQPPTDVANLAFAEQMRDRLSVALHVRWFDGISNAEGYDLSDVYYRNAIEIIEREFGHKAHYYVFSDKPDQAKRRIELPPERVSWISHNVGDDMAYADLWLMTQCKHFITANSTFSWWAAWLAENKMDQQLTLTPNVRSVSGTCGWGFEGLIPPRWNVV